MTSVSETRLLPCRVCDGAGEWDEGPINCGGPAGGVSPEYRQVICGQCDGTGVEEQEVEPSEIEDTIYPERDHPPTEAERFALYLAYSSRRLYVRPGSTP